MIIEICKCIINQHYVLFIKVHNYVLLIKKMYHIKTNCVIFIKKIFFKEV